MNALREQYFAALKTACGKQLVSKSAVAGPQIVALRDANGRIFGFSSAEHLSADDPAIAPHLKQSMQKAADTTDPNSVFDSLFTELHSIGVSETPKISTKKSAEPETADPNKLLDNLVPQLFRSWPL